MRQTISSSAGRIQFQRMDHSGWLAECPRNLVAIVAITIKRHPCGSQKDWIISSLMSFSWHFVYMSTNLTLAIRWDFQEVQWNYHQDNVKIAGTSCYTPHTFGKTLLFWAFLFGVHVMNLQDRSQTPQLRFCFQHNKQYFSCGELQTWWRDAPCTT